jgi:protein gp37
MDWAEDHPDAQRLRPGIWETIRRHPNISFQLLTKRADRIQELLPVDWDRGYPNVWLGVSIEDMRVAWRADALRQIPAVVRFVSYEPALGPLDQMSLDGIDWVIYGGESGIARRPEDKDWARSMRDRCRSAGIAFFHKQSSHRFTEHGIELDGEVIREFPSERKEQRL